MDMETTAASDRALHSTWQIDSQAGSIPTGEPPEHTEWVDGEIVEKTGMTLRHGWIQSRLGFYWQQYAIAQNLGGKTFVETSCRTNKQIRRPDVSYLTPELFSCYASERVLPQSFSLIAEIVSPDDGGESLFAKAAEYLASGSQEVWLVFPESLWVVILTARVHLLLTVGETASTQDVLPGFSISVSELLDIQSIAEISNNGEGNLSESPQS